MYVIFVIPRLFGSRKMSDSQSWQVYLTFSAGHSDVSETRDERDLAVVALSGVRRERLGTKGGLGKLKTGH